MLRVTSIYGRIALPVGRNGKYNGAVWPFITALGILLAVLLGTVPEGGLAATWPWLLLAGAVVLLAVYVRRLYKRKTTDMIREIMENCAESEPRE